VKWDPVSQSFTNVGSGFNNWVYSLKFDANGTLYAGGSFTNTYLSTEADRSAPKLAVGRVAMWNGTHWTNMGHGLSDTALSLTVNTNNNDVYASGFFKIAYQDDGTDTNTWYVAKYGPQAIASSGVDPSSGFVAGGYEVVITGTNLGNGGDITNVTLCGAHVNSIMSQSATQVVVVAGGGAPGLGDVRIFSTSFGESVASNVFTYNGPSFTLRGTNGAEMASGATADANAGTDFGMVPTGVTVTNVFSITNAGNAMLNLTWTTNGSANFSVVSGPATVGEGEAADFSIAYASSGAAAAAAVEIVHNAAFSPFTLNVASDLAMQDQLITFPVIAPQWESDQAGLAATASSGLPVSFAVVDGPALLTEDTNLTFSGVGVVHVAASQAGDASWHPAPAVTNAIHVYRASVRAGPFAGGNSMTISNGYIGSITNVLVGGMGVTPVESGDTWFTIVLPFLGSTGAVDLIVQTSDNGEVTLAGAYSYNPAGTIGYILEDWGQWQPVAGLPAPMAHGKSALLDGRLFVAGGWRGYSASSTNAASFDGASWRLEPALPASLRYFGAATYSGTYFAVAGHSGLATTNIVHQFDGSVWSTSTPYPVGKASMLDAAVYDGYLFAAGGHDGNQGNARTNMYRFNGASWEEVAGLPARRFNHAMQVFNGALYVLGGLDQDGTAHTNVYRFDGSTWVEEPGLPVAKASLATTTLRGELYVVAGQVGFNPVNSVHKFNGTNWMTVSDYPLSVIGLVAEEMDNYLYAAGGTTDDFFSYVTNAYRYPWREVDPGVFPDSGSWTGGYEVVIDGENLGDGGDITHVTLCGVASAIQSQSATQVVVVAGVGHAGVGDVRVYSTSFGETVKSNAFTYLREQPAALVFAPTSPQAYGSTNALDVSGGSGTGAVQYAVLSGPGTLVDDTYLTVTAGGGTVVVVATRIQDDRYYATATTGMVEAIRATATVALMDLIHTYDGSPKPVTATTEPAGLVVVFTYEGDTNAPVAAGSYAVTGTVVEANWQGETTGTLSIAQTSQTITFPAIGDQITTSVVELAATASSGLEVTFAVGSGPATITGNTNLAFTGAGEVSIIASQVGGANYEAAPDVTNTFNVLGLYTVTIVSAHGSTDPVPGGYEYRQGTVITNTVTTPDNQGTTQYVATGWDLTNHEPATGVDTDVIITVTNDTILTWRWTTNYWLDTAAGPNGSVDVANGWQAAGATVQIEALAEAHYAFATWSGDASGHENPLNLLMTGPRVITASFVALWTTNNPTPQWWLAQYGITNDMENATDQDTDGDGIPNWQEFIMDTDPTSDRSYLAVRDLGPAYGTNCRYEVWTNDVPPYEVATNRVCDISGMILGWPVSTNRIYDVESSEAVLPENWQRTPGLSGIAPSSGWLIITNDLEGLQRTWRVRVGLPD
jgi:hypothetical protein